MIHIKLNIETNEWIVDQKTETIVQNSLRKNLLFIEMPGAVSENYFCSLSFLRNADEKPLPALQELQAIPGTREFDTGEVDEETGEPIMEERQGFNFLFSSRLITAQAGALYVSANIYRYKDDGSDEFHELDENDPEQIEYVASFSQLPLVVSPSVVVKPLSDEDEMAPISKAQYNALLAGMSQTSDRIYATQEDLGKINELETEDKESAVAAINWLKNNYASLVEDNYYLGVNKFVDITAFYDDVFIYTEDEYRRPVINAEYDIPEKSQKKFYAVNFPLYNELENRDTEVFFPAESGHLMTQEQHDADIEEINTEIELVKEKHDEDMQKLIEYANGKSAAKVYITLRQLLEDLYIAGAYDIKLKDKNGGIIVRVVDGDLGDYDEYSHDKEIMIDLFEITTNAIPNEELVNFGRTGDVFFFKNDELPDLWIDTSMPASDDKTYLNFYTFDSSKIDLLDYLNLNSSVSQEINSTLIQRGQVVHYGKEQYNNENIYNTSSKVKVNTANFEIVQGFKIKSDTSDYNATTNTYAQLWMPMGLAFGTHLNYYLPSKNGTLALQEDLDAMQQEIFDRLNGKITTFTYSNFGNFLISMLQKYHATHYRIGYITSSDKIKYGEWQMVNTGAATMPSNVEKIDFAIYDEEEDRYNTSLDIPTSGAFNTYDVIRFTDWNYNEGFNYDLWVTVTSKADNKCSVSFHTIDARAKLEGVALKEDVDREVQNLLDIISSQPNAKNFITFGDFLYECKTNLGATHFQIRKKDGSFSQNYSIDEHVRLDVAIYLCDITIPINSAYFRLSIYNTDTQTHNYNFPTDNLINLFGKYCLFHLTDRRDDNPDFYYIATTPNADVSTAVFHFVDAVQTGTKSWYGTQEEYDALEIKEDDVDYNIYEEE